MRNPRVAITFNDREFALIERLSEVTETPKSKVLHEFFQLAFPTMEAMLNNLLRVRQMDERFKDDIVSNLDKALASNQEAIEMLNEILMRSVSEPPSSNTGAGLDEPRGSDA